MENFYENFRRDMSQNALLEGLIFIEGCIKTRGFNEELYLMKTQTHVDMLMRGLLLVTSSFGIVGIAITIQRDVTVHHSSKCN